MPAALYAAPLFVGYSVTTTWPSGQFYWNFGQRPFTYTPPSGFVRLNTFNLTTPTIGATAAELANKYMDVLTWSGTGGSAGATRSLTGLGFKPDFVWEKDRASSQDHHLFDSVRGAGLSKTLASNSTNAEGSFNDTLYGYLSSFDSDGMTTTNGSSTWDNWNKSGDTYVAWNWRASNATAVTNTNGSITSSVSASTTAGFSIVTYTGTGANATVGHGLGVAPSMVIYKRRSASDGWAVYFSSIGATNNLVLQSTAAQQANGNVYWNSTAPTSTVFTAGTDSAVNASTATYVAYCFAPIAGYSAFGTYTGNGSTDGTFVYTGFRPAFLMIKRTNAAVNWYMFDNKRNTYNAVNLQLSPNLSNAEASDFALDFLSNGFKFRIADSYVNGSGDPYIYMAFAESPFKYANAR
jgi:hypothetical protein